MEEILMSFGTNYVIDGELIPIQFRKSVTPLGSLIKINGQEYKCEKVEGPTLCSGCSFENTYGTCDEWFLPCSRNDREDGQNCIYVKHIVLEEKKFYTSSDFKNLETYRFK